MGGIVFRRFLVIFVVLYITRDIRVASSSSNHVISKRDEAFRCFSCDEESRELCQARGKLKNCDKGTNTCFTQIRYYGGTFKVKQIVKNCILGPSCDEEVEKSANDECDKRENDFDCVKCCYKELCNRDSGTWRISSNSGIIIAMVLFTIIFHFHVTR